MKRISLDCMGGDYAPKAIVQGAVLAAAEFGLDLLLVGEEHAIGKELSVLHTKGLKIDIVPTTQVITFDDAPALAVRRLK
ncbi:MAG TPA: phosphate--acyl-ACP acyltransferase, partial [Bacillota bacterium]|nr:phosphate--acyl-ACP acyltransferase [Bacillota bacterium]